MATSDAACGQPARSSAIHDVSVVLLTYQRNYLLRQQLEHLAGFRHYVREVIVVDNASDPPASEVCGAYPWVTLVRAPRNLGAAGRNLGFDAATGTFLVTLDDDVLGFSEAAARRVTTLLSDANIACVNFRVVEQHTGRLVNWVHHRDPDRFASQSFDTYEITEGAAAFRTDCLRAVGGYPETFFLSHEGPDLGYRLMDRGWRVIYDPSITVEHLFAPEGRPGWRSYYYDTRNTLWLVVRNLPVGYGAKVFLRQTLAMMVFALRDGYFRTWMRALRDAVAGYSVARQHRRRLSPDTMARIRAIDRFRPPLLPTIWRRLRSPFKR